MIDEITSKENVNIKYAKKMMSSARFRKDENSFIIEGLRLCNDALKSSVIIHKVFYTKRCYEKFSEIISNIISKSEKSFLVDESIIKLISDTDSPQGIVCICEKIHNKYTCEQLKNFDKIILLENIQNPSNLGSILRTCDALNLKAVGISSNSCDVYNPKVLRGSMGAAFRLKIAEFENTCDMIKTLQNCGFKAYATVPDNSAFKLGSMEFESKSALVFGNEGNGLLKATIEFCDKKVTIPMNENAESLNVATAVGIAIWEMTGRGNIKNGRTNL